MYVRCAAHDLQGFTATRIDLTHAQTIRIRMRRNRYHPPHDHPAELGRDRLQRFDFESGHGEQM